MKQLVHNVSDRRQVSSSPLRRQALALGAPDSYSGITNVYVSESGTRE
jgi:hypothetical protein